MTITKLYLTYVLFVLTAFWRLQFLPESNKQTNKQPKNANKQKQKKKNPNQNT